MSLNQLWLTSCWRMPRHQVSHTENPGRTGRRIRVGLGYESGSDWDTNPGWNRVRIRVGLGDESGSGLATNPGRTGVRIRVGLGYESGSDWGTNPGRTGRQIPARPPSWRLLTHHQVQPALTVVTHQQNLLLVDERTVAALDWPHLSPG